MVQWWSQKVIQKFGDSKISEKKKSILLFSKNALNVSEATTKTFIMPQNISI